MTKILVLTDEMAEFITLAMAHWAMNTDGEPVDKIGGQRVLQLIISNQIKGHYTKDELDVLQDEARRMVG